MMMPRFNTLTPGTDLTRAPVQFTTTRSSEGSELGVFTHANASSSPSAFHSGHSHHAHAGQFGAHGLWGGAHSPGAGKFHRGSLDPWWTSAAHAPWQHDGHTNSAGGGTNGSELQISSGWSPWASNTDERSTPDFLADVRAIRGIFRPADVHEEARTTPTHQPLSLAVHKLTDETYILDDAEKLAAAVQRAWLGDAAQTEEQHLPLSLLDDIRAVDPLLVQDAYESSSVATEEAGDADRIQFAVDDEEEDDDDDDEVGFDEDQIRDYNNHHEQRQQPNRIENENDGWTAVATGRRRAKRWSAQPSPQAIDNNGQKTTSDVDAAIPRHPFMLLSSQATGEDDEDDLDHSDGDSEAPADMSLMLASDSASINNEASKLQQLQRSLVSHTLSLEHTLRSLELSDSEKKLGTSPQPDLPTSAHDASSPRHHGTQHAGHRRRFLHDWRPEGSTLRLAVESDVGVFQLPNGAPVALHIATVPSGNTAGGSAEVLDREVVYPVWIDSVSANATEAAVCYVNSDGCIQGYDMCHVDDLPRRSLPAFDRGASLERGVRVLEFLKDSLKHKHNGTTHWLLSDSNTGELHLYDATRLLQGASKDSAASSRRRRSSAHPPEDANVSEVRASTSRLSNQRARALASVMLTPLDGSRASAIIAPPVTSFEGTDAADNALRAISRAVEKLEEPLARLGDRGHCSSKGVAAVAVWDAAALELGLGHLDAARLLLHAGASPGSVAGVDSAPSQSAVGAAVLLVEKGLRHLLRAGASGASAPLLTRAQRFLGMCLLRRAANSLENATNAQEARAAAVDVMRASKAAKTALRVAQSMAQDAAEDVVACRLLCAEVSFLAAADPCLGAVETTRHLHGSVGHVFGCHDVFARWGENRSIGSYIDVPDNSVDDNASNAVRGILSRDAARSLDAALQTLVTVERSGGGDGGGWHAVYEAALRARMRGGTASTLSPLPQQAASGAGPCQSGDGGEIAGAMARLIAVCEDALRRRGGGSTS